MKMRSSEASKDIKSGRPQFGAAYQYNTNVVLKPTADIPGLQITGEKDSSVVTTLRFNYNTPLGGPWFFNGQYSFYANTYFHVHTHNLIDNTLFLSPGYNFSNGCINLPCKLQLHPGPAEMNTSGFFRPVPLSTTCFFQTISGKSLQGMEGGKCFNPPLLEEENRTGNIYYLLVGYSPSFLRGKRRLLTSDANFQGI